MQTFAERGYHAASINAIARAAGISKPVVYGPVDVRRQERPRRRGDHAGSRRQCCCRQCRTRKQTHQTARRATQPPPPVRAGEQPCRLAARSLQAAHQSAPHRNAILST
ncbi:MAG: helix-turn-helix domain-containing protein [Solirubrobacteraceae bacterium]